MICFSVGVTAPGNEGQACPGLGPHEDVAWGGAAGGRGLGARGGRRRGDGDGAPQLLPLAGPLLDPPAAPPTGQPGKKRVRKGTGGGAWAVREERQTNEAVAAWKRDHDWTAAGIYRK